MSIELDAQRILKYWDETNFADETYTKRIIKLLDGPMIQDVRYDFPLVAVEIIKLLKERNIYLSSREVRTELIDFVNSVYTVSGITDHTYTTRVISSYEPFNDCKILYKDRLGTDMSIAESAKESYGAANDFVYNAPWDQLLETTYNIINTLSKNNHSSPYEQASLTCKIKLPIFSDRQIVRHRTQRRNEKSARYTTVSNSMYLPPDERLLECMKRDVKTLKTPDEIRALFRKAYDASFEVYEELLTYIPKELARAVLPLSMNTEYVFNMDLNNLQKLWDVRLDSHAQFETRQIACGLFWVALHQFPITTGLYFFNRFMPQQIMKAPWHLYYNPQ